MDQGEPINLKKLISLISNAKFIIANDTGPAHIASHLNKKGVVLFGSHTSPEKVSIGSSNFKALSVNNLSDLTSDEVLNEIKKKLQ
jgi:ADP-heptose:LPS heptosyltransferase